MSVDHNLPSSKLGAVFGSSTHVPRMSPTLSVELAKLTMEPFKVASAIHPTKASLEAIRPSFATKPAGMPPMYSFPCRMFNDGDVALLLRIIAEILAYVKKKIVLTP